MQLRFGAGQHSDATFKLLADVHRAKRMMRKVITGNIVRELRIRRMMGQRHAVAARRSGLRHAQA